MKQGSLTITRAVLAVLCFIVGLAGAVFGHIGYHQFANAESAPGERAARREAALFSLDRAFTRFESEHHEEMLAHFSTVRSGEDVRVLDAALARIFPDGVDAPGEPEVLAVLSYVAQMLKLEASNRHLGSEVLAEGRAYCYGIARAFEALCRRMGLPARINAMHNFEYMQAHNSVEVYYAGQWRFFDPTYGTFFYDRAEYEGQGRIPSGRELFSGSVSSDNLFMVCDALWTGTYDPDWRVHAVPDDFRYRGMFTMRQLYDRVFDKAFPFIPSEIEMSSFPITIDLGDLDRRSLGEIDGSSTDVEGRQPDSTYPRYHGASYVGHVVMGPAFHTLTVKADRPGRFKMTYHFLPRSRFDTMGTVELRDVIVERHEAQENAWSVWFRLQDAEGIFLVVNRQHTAFLDAITVERIE